MNAHRFDHWPSLLSAYLESRRTVPFRYGSHDCCLFAADAILAITGIDPAASFRNRYQSAFGATRRMRETCAQATVDRLAAIVFAECGFPAIAPVYASRGDIVAIRQPLSIVLAVIALDGRPVIAAESGWCASDRKHAIAAWRI